MLKEPIMDPIKLFDLMSGDQIGATINHPGEILSLDLSTDRKKLLLHQMQFKSEQSGMGHPIAQF